MTSDEWLSGSNTPPKMMQLTADSKPIAKNSTSGGLMQAAS